MKLKKDKKEEENKKAGNIQIVMGDNSNLDISDVGDCMNNLRPKENQKKKVVIPKTKKKDK